MICSKSDDIEKIVEILKNGGTSIVPTDTVYGFSGVVDLKDRKSFKTDDRIRKIKGREESKPLIQLIANPEDIYSYTDFPIPEKIMRLWPGALTVIVPVKINSPLKDYCPTVAFRCPGDEWLRRVIDGCGAPLYSTSVNRSGSPVLETFYEIRKEFETEVDILVDDGDKKGSLPSTLVMLEDKEIKVLRQGSVRID